MSTTTIPPALYKYLALEPDLTPAAQILRDLSIRFSQVSVLNDVDEFQPLYRGFAARERTEEASREFLLRKYPTECANVYRNLPISHADQVICKVANNGADNLERSFQEGKIGRDLYAKLDSNFGMLSLSATVTSKLMWAFYSDGGRGIVVEFAPSHIWFNNKTSVNDSFRHLRQVSYVADREPTHFLTAKDDEVLYTKTCDWEFENEWRMIRNLNEGKMGSKLDRYGKEVFLFVIPPSAIQTVIFGYRTTSENQKALREIVSANTNLKHIMFRRAVRNIDGKIEIVPD
jgi:hypothetical protein